MPEAHGLLVGHNTDVAGVQSALQGAGVEAGNGRNAVVLGTGGAARAAAYALVNMGFVTTMLGRSLDGVREFAKVHGVRLGSLSERVIGELLPSVVVHATPVGSLDRDPGERLLPGWKPAAGTVVMEMVYQPYWTRLLREAADAGATVVPGVDMFLAQAQAQVKLFTGKVLEPASLRAFLAGTAGAVRA